MRDPWRANPRHARLVRELEVLLRRERDEGRPPATQAALAGLLGTTQASVSRALAELKVCPVCHGYRRHP